MKVELTDTERETLYDETICPDCGDGFAIRDTLIPAVESIVAAHVAEALNGLAAEFDDHVRKNNAAPWIPIHLRVRAAEAEAGATDG